MSIITMTLIIKVIVVSIFPYDIDFKIISLTNSNGHGSVESCLCLSYFVYYFFEKRKIFHLHLIKFIFDPTLVVRYLVMLEVARGTTLLQYCLLFLFVLVL